MERHRITCPETTTTETIDLERTPAGVVIAGCSRFRPCSALTCSRACAAGVDRRDRRGAGDVDPRVLVVYIGSTKQTKSLADALAAHLVRDGLTVELADADAGSVPPPADYDAVVIGSSVRFGRHPLSLIDYIAQHGDALATIPTFLFSIGSEDDLARMSNATGWRPTGTAAFEPIAPDRRRFLHKLGGTPPGAAATSTNASRVRAFALMIGEDVPTPELVPTLQPSR